MLQVLALAESGSLAPERARVHHTDYLRKWDKLLICRLAPTRADYS